MQFHQLNSVIWESRSNETRLWFSPRKPHAKFYMNIKSSWSKAIMLTRMIKQEDKAILYNQHNYVHWYLTCSIKRSIHFMVSTCIMLAASQTWTWKIFNVNRFTLLESCCQTYESISYLNQAKYCHCIFVWKIPVLSSSLDYFSWMDILHRTCGLKSNKSKLP